MTATKFCASIFSRCIFSIKNNGNFDISAFFSIFKNHQRKKAIFDSFAVIQQKWAIIGPLRIRLCAQNYQNKSYLPQHGRIGRYGLKTKHERVFPNIEKIGLW